MADKMLTSEEYMEMDVFSIFEDQDLMAVIPNSHREEVGVMLLESVAQYAPSCLAHWLTIDEAQWPVNDSDTWEYDDAVQAWQQYLETGHSNTDWFCSQYRSVE